MQWSELSSVKVATLKRQILKRLKTGLSPICCPHSRCQPAIRTALVSGRSLRLALATGELDAALLCRVGGSWTKSLVTRGADKFKSNVA